MLSSEQSIIEYRGARAMPDRLIRKDHGHYVRYAEQMLAVYQGGLGQTRRDLHRFVAGILANEPDCPSKRIQAFCKLLDDAGEFETDPHGNAATLRMRVFSMAAPQHPLVRAPKCLFGTPEQDAKSKIAQELGEPWESIEARLYVDVLDFQPLKSFVGYESAELLLRHYNVAQVQACLYHAEHMAIVARKDFRRILRHVKFARLMFELHRLAPSEYRIDLTGPASVLSETRRYGVQFAQIIPGLLACDDWELEAVVQTPWRTKARFSLASTEGLRSHLASPPEFDSGVEANFAAKFGETRDGWTLMREPAILHEHQTTFVPDFAFRHADGTEVLFEIVGFWTPKYLEEKRDTLRRFRQYRILLAVPEDSLTPNQTPPDNVIIYKTAIKLEPVLSALARVRESLRR
jgi:predicted nuclease of restriction endonuclease-like RecB superfamily